MVAKIKVLAVGKTKEGWLESAIGEYVTRLKKEITLEQVVVKDDAQLLKLVAKERQVIALDPAGSSYSSEEFSNLLSQKIEKGGARLAFVIGGAEGLPLELKKGALVSLSPLTMTHQIVRLVLVEQIYRAIQIQKGTPYHK